MTRSYDVIVIGGGAIGASIAYHCVRFGARRVLLAERGAIGGGTTAQSSCILRTHYSVPENIALARASWAIYADFARYLDDDEADCGLVRCGYLIAAPPGDLSAALTKTVTAQRALGIGVERLDAGAAHRLLPIARFDDDECIAFEPQAGFADAYLATSAWVRNARRLGCEVREGLAVTALLRSGDRVTGVQTRGGAISADVVISAQNVWSGELARWTGVDLPLRIERHAVLALDCPPAPYTHAMPVFKDLRSEDRCYCRSYGGTRMLVGKGTPAPALGTPDTTQAEVSLHEVADVGAQVAERFPAYGEAGLASSWTGLYDVMPDWNPVLGTLPGIDGLLVAFGFSGHGFKLAPAVGRVLAQRALGLPTDVPLAPYALQRFGSGALLQGRYGSGAVS